MVFAGFDMASISLPMDKEDRLEGSSNFHVWKMRILNIFQEHDRLRFIETDPPSLRMSLTKLPLEGTRPRLRDLFLPQSRIQ